MTQTDVLNIEELSKEVPFICPECQTKNKLAIPKKIINQSKQLTTVSIPQGMICDHSFQAFIDKNFKIRGYQKVDFDLSKMEYMESSEIDKDSGQEAEPLVPLIQDIVQLLRKYVDENDNDVTGSSIFTLEGRVLYSSLPTETLHNTIREFEVRNKQNLTLVKKLFLLLENDEKIFSEYLTYHEHKLIVVLTFSESVKLGMGNLYLVNLIKEIKKL